MIIGLRTGIKIKSFDDYAKFYKNYNPGLLGISLSMSIFGSGSLLGVFNQTQTMGIIYAIASFGYIINCLITAKFITPFFDGRFRQALSVCEIFKYFYGARAEKVAAIVALIFNTCAASTGFIVLGLLIQYLFMIEYKIGAAFAAMFSIIYSSIGGIRAITLLDLIKCTMLLIFIPILSNFATFNAGGILYVLENTDSNYFNVINHPNFTQYLLLFIFFSIPTHTLQPIVVQRILLINNPDVTKKSLYTYSLIRVALLWMVVAIALSALIQHPNSSFAQIITEGLPPVLKGFTLVTIFIIILGKIDAHLNSSGMIFVRSLISNYHGMYTLRYIRFATVLIGCIASFIAILQFPIVNIIVFIETLWSAVVGVPLLAGLLGIQLSNRDIGYYLIFALFLCCIYKFFHIYSASLVIIVLSVCTFTTLYLLRFRYQKLYNYGLLSLISLFFDKCRFYIKKFINYIYIHINQDKPKHINADYFAFSLFFCINYTFLFFMWDFTKEDVTQVLLLRVLSIILCLLLIIKPLWPVYCEKYFNLYWNSTLMITLPFNALFILLSEEWSIICLINAILSIFLLSKLTSWVSFIILLTIGCCSAFSIYYFSISNALFSHDIYLNYIALYSYIFSTLIVLIFTRRKEDQTSRELYLSKILGGAVAHELRTYLLTIKNYIRPIILSNKTKETQIYLGEIKKTLDEAFSFIDILLTNIQGPKPMQKLTKLSIQDCMNYAISLYPMSKDKKDLIVNNIDHDFCFLGEREMITHVIFNLINNSLYYSANRDDLIITVSTLESLQYNYLIFYDNGPGIKPDMINKIFNKFYTANKKGTGLGLPFCKLSMQLIGGNILCNSVEGKYTEFKLKFPKTDE